VRELALAEVVERDHYANLRDRYRSAVIAYKRPRRISVGENVTLVFENRETIRFQVQEMLWVEGIRRDDKIQFELDTYNELIPKDGELSATLFVDITDGEAIRPTLDRLLGVDEHVSLVLGDAGDEQRIRAVFDPKQMDEDRLSAVQYIKFRLDPQQQRLFCDPAQPARVEIDHANYRREVEIAPATRASLAGDLTGEPESLLPAFDPDALPRDEILFETDAIRARRPARPFAVGHVVVEPLQPVASLLDASPQLLSALMTGVQRVAADVVREHGECRVQAAVGHAVGALSWHVFAPTRS